MKTDHINPARLRAHGDQTVKPIVQVLCIISKELWILPQANHLTSIRLAVDQGVSH